MRRSPWLMMMLAALLVWWAARLVPQALAFATATVNVEGSLRVSTNNTAPFVACTALPDLGTIARGAFKSLTVTCYNNTGVALDVTLNLGTLTPPPQSQPPSNTMPLVSWSNTVVVPSKTITVPGTGTKSATATLYVYAPGNTRRGKYTQAYTSTANITTGFDYFKNHTVTFTVQ